MTGSRYPRPLEGTEPSWYGRTANDVLTGPLVGTWRPTEEPWYGDSADETYGHPVYSLEVPVMPDMSRAADALRAAHRYEVAPAHVKYAANLAAKMEELKAREELTRALAPATPWPTVMDELVAAATEAFEPVLEAWRQIARAAADAVRHVMSIPSVRRYAYAEVDAKAEAEAIRTGARYWTDHRGQPRRNPNRQPLLANGKKNRRVY